MGKIRRQDSEKSRVDTYILGITQKKKIRRREVLRDLLYSLNVSIKMHIKI